MPCAFIYITIISRLLAFSKKKKKKILRNNYTICQHDFQVQNANTNSVKTIGSGSCKGRANRQQLTHATSDTLEIAPNCSLINYATSWCNDHIR